ncbi:MAG: hypothetical protein Q8R39_02930 [bacterium]|nr:hypothetical protein [bacterium]MDZ4284381.1 hypothetical protein [Patescibacteria group bacterium]
MKRFIYPAIGSGVFLLPLIARAEDTGVLAILTSILYIVDSAIPALLAVALFFFLFGLLKSLIYSGSEDAQKEGRRFMVYGVVTLFVMLSVWGLVGVLHQLTGIPPGGDAPPLPKLAE